MRGKPPIYLFKAVYMLGAKKKKSGDQIRRLNDEAAGLSRCTPRISCWINPDESAPPDFNQQVKVNLR